MTTGGLGQRRVVGRYVLYGAIASGGMATVHYGRLVGPVGFARTVAIKRLHEHLAKDPEFVRMFLDEARLAARIRHPNVVSVLDVVAQDGELLLVMDYVQGESLGRLVRAAQRSGGIPHPIVSALLIGLLQGLHSAHDARSDRGEPLHIVHRDVSPQNVIVGVDGTAQVLDFGVAKAAGRTQNTSEGQVKGKFSYMSPEQLGNLEVDRRTDVFAAAVVLWETLTGKRLFEADSHAAIVYAVINQPLVPPSQVVPGVSPALDAVVMRGLARNPAARFQSAFEMAQALEAALPPASPMRVQEWVRGIAADVLAERAQRVREIENDSVVSQIGPNPMTLLTPVSGIGSVAGAAVPASAPAPRKRSAALTVAAVAGSAVIGIGLAVLAATQLGGSAPSPASTAAGASANGSVAPSAAPVAPPSVAPPSATADASATPAADPSAAPSATADASATPAADPSATPAADPSATPATTPASKPVARPRPRTVDCSHPFTVDSRGRKKPRPECF